MSGNEKLSAVERRYEEYKASLLEISSAAENSVLQKLDSIGLTKSDALEFLDGMRGLHQGIQSVITEADLLVGKLPAAKPHAMRMLGHCRALVAGGMFVGKHTDVTESAKVLLGQERTAEAHRGTTAKYDERLAIARPLIVAAKRKPNGRLNNSKALLATVNEALGEVKNDTGKPRFKPIGARTLDRYFKAVEQHRTE